MHIKSRRALLVVSSSWPSSWAHKQRIVHSSSYGLPLQVPSSRDAGPKQTLHIPPAYTEILKSKLKCDRYGETQQQCPGQIRSSYPLLWNPAKKCKNNRQASPLPTATETSQPAAEWQTIGYATMATSIRRVRLSIFSVFVATFLIARSSQFSCELLGPS